MARRVFFSFHYERDLWRVNVVRNSGMIEGIAAAGFQDQSLWEAAKKTGDAAIKRLINTGLEGTSVTVVLIGAETATRQYVAYEVGQSIARSNGLLGIRIHNIKDREGRFDPPGAIPPLLAAAGAPVYDWEYGRLGEWVERAYQSVRQR